MLILVANVLGLEVVVEEAAELEDDDIDVEVANVVATFDAGATELGTIAAVAEEDDDNDDGEAKVATTCAPQTPLRTSFPTFDFI